MDLHELRKSHDLTIPQIAEVAGVSPSTWANWEKNGLPRNLVSLIYTAIYFGVSVEDLLTRKEAETWLRSKHIGEFDRD